MQPNGSPMQPNAAQWEPNGSPMGAQWEPNGSPMQTLAWYSEAGSVNMSWPFQKLRLVNTYGFDKLARNVTANVNMSELVNDKLIHATLFSLR